MHTAGPWTLRQDEKWPFDLVIVGPAGNCVAAGCRVATSTSQNTLAECLEAKGFEYTDKAAIRADLEKQVDNFRVMAAAPDLLAMLAEVLADTEAWRIGKDTRDRARAAIAKATNPQE